MSQPPSSSNGGGVNAASANTGAGGGGESSTATGSASASTSTPTSSLPTVPWAFIDCSTDTLIVLISHMLNLLIQHNDQVVLTPDALTRFHSRAAPGISVLEYLRRIVKYTNMEKIPLLSLLAYIDITCQHLPTFTLSSLTVHRFLIAGVCAGSKAQCDVFCTNAHYAKVGGIKVQELNALEREFLKVTQWNLCCNADLLQRYYTSLIKSHGGFTQLPEPSVIPFKAFPRSSSKPRSSEDADQEMGEPDQDSGEGPEGDADCDDDAEAEDDDEASPSGSSSKRRSVDVTDMIEQVSPSLSSGAGRRKMRSSDRRRSSTYETNDDGMEVDPDPDRSPSSPVSPATSSVPSSSRSSLRGGSRRRGRALSLSYTDARPAEPHLDKTPASGSPFKSPRDRDMARRSPISQSSQGRLASTAAASAIEEAMHANRGTEEARGEDQHEQHHHSHHDHHGAHLLKSLVGGIFNRRKSTNVDKPAPPPPPSSHSAVPSTERSVSGSASASTNGSHLVLPFLPVKTQQAKSPVAAHLPPPPVPLPRPSSSTIPNPPPSASPAMPPQVAPKSRNSSVTRSPRVLMSPGLAKPITPKIRTFEEMGEVPMT